MDTEYAEISVSGTVLKVPSAQVNGKTVIVTGRWLKIATIKGEEWEEGEVTIPPDQFLAHVGQLRHLGADLFTFTQTLLDRAPRFLFYHDWDSVAAIPVVSFADWWRNRVSSYLRKDVRKAAKLGVEVRPIPFDDDFVRGIMKIYDETPVRQGRPFWHYKKDFDAVKRENGTYLERSEFLGAFFGGELIGFLKIVFVDRVARLMQIISKVAHQDKRPMNALIAKAVEVCEAKGCYYLTYGKYRYSQGADSVTAFKHRNGFEEILIPRYYVPLTIKGRMVLRLRLHRGAKELVPGPILQTLRRLRASIYRHQLLPRNAA